MEKKVLNHFCHEHPLILTENVSDKESPNCYGCDNPVANLEMAYVCMEHDCRSTNRRMMLHKKCGELPSEIRHPKHPHPINLFDFRELSVSWCDICGRDNGGDKVLGYRCSSCVFCVDTACVDALLEEEKRELQHPSHPTHPLTLMRKPAFAFQCDGCGAQDVDMAYICSACEYMVHKSCALLPTILPADDEYHHHHHHHHPLSLIFSMPEEHRKYKHYCDVCYKPFDTTCWVYFCGDCRYFIHIKCVGSTAKPVSKLIEDDDGPDVIEFPLHANDISNKLITPFVMRQKGVDNIPADAINETASYLYLSEFHHHRLSLVSKLPHKDEEDEDEEGEESRDNVELKICDVCVTPISSPPYYHCSASANYGCNFFIHFICCFLPNTLHSPSNPRSSQLYGNCQDIPNKNHNFTLYAMSKSKARDAISYWYCNLCNVYTNGMGYECEECGIKIDLKCASLPTTIRHASHPHHKPLLLTTSISPPQEVGRRKRCHGCYNYIFNMEYCCSDEECDFALGLECALLPKSITEREWDKHPLLLTFDASLDHPSDFFCEFCEEEINPKSWMYHCRQCDVSFDLFCLKNASGDYRNMKIWGGYELDGIHPNHPLTFTYITLKRRCDVCHKDVYTNLGFECASCYYVVCWNCGDSELEKISVWLIQLLRCM